MSKFYIANTEINTQYLGNTQINDIILNVTPSFVGLLDTYPGAGVAYSVRQLSSTYTSNCIEVRRSSDNATQNIGFVNNALDTASLLSFCGAGNGFVKTWYDQSGNALNATQTTNASQLQIVNGGSVITQNSIPTISGSAPTFMNFSPNISQPNTVFFAAKSNGDSSKHFYDTTPRQLVGYSGGFISYAGSVLSYGSTPTTFQLVSALFSGSNSTLQSNNATTVSGSTGTAAMTGTCMLMAGDGTNNGIIGVMSEFIVYPSDQSSNKTGIKTNINTYYSIF